MVRLSESEVQRRRAAWQEPSSDVQAARRLGLRTGAFSRWRRRRGLPAKAPRGSPPVPIPEANRRRLAYAQTSTDGEAARLLGLTRDAFVSWRQRARLPAKTPKGGSVLKAEGKRRLQTYRATSSDQEAARSLGLSVNGFRQWRSHQGLASKNRSKVRRLTPALQRRRRALYDRGCSDAEIGRRLGRDESAIHHWRRRNGRAHNPVHRISRAERRRRFAAYRATPNDVAAARRLGLAPSPFHQWRAAQGLPAKQAPVARVSRREHARRLDAYHRTRNDREAARRLQMPPYTFISWRIKADLVSKASRGPRLSPGEEARRHRIYWSSPTDAAAARAMRLSRTGYQYWRRTRELPPRRPQPVPSAALVETRKRVIASRRTQREAADELGVRQATISKWARRYGIARPRDRPRTRRPRGRSPGPARALPEAAP